MTAETNVCYCGEYGGGVHTKSARCVVARPPEKSVSALRAIRSWLLLRDEEPRAREMDAAADLIDFQAKRIEQLERDLLTSLRQRNDESRLRQAAERAARPPPSAPKEYEGHDYRSGVFTNCGYHGTASGFIVRDGKWWVATFRNENEANQYVATRNTQPLKVDHEGRN